jgi:hypothetical protein
LNPSSNWKALQKVISISSYQSGNLKLASTQKLVANSFGRASKRRKLDAEIILSQTKETQEEPVKSTPSSDPGKQARTDRDLSDMIERFQDDSLSESQRK